MGPNPVPLDELTVEGLVAGIRGLVERERYREVAVRVQGNLLGEDGVTTAVDSILRSTVISML